MNVINTNGCRISYDLIRKAAGDKPFTASLVGAAAAVAQKAVNIGIDSALEACFVPDRGDRYTHGERRVRGRLLTTTLEMVVSIESLPTLIRRLFELHGTDDEQNEAQQLAEDILMVLGIDDSGQFVGREALGLD